MTRYNKNWYSATGGLYNSFDRVKIIQSVCTALEQWIRKRKSGLTDSWHPGERLLALINPYSAQFTGAF
jgi:hypothetical protein